MPFNLKKVGVTYQWLVNKVFKDQIHCNMEVYLDDMLIKSHTLRSHVNELEKTFTNLHRYQMKLNPAKCIFEVTSGTFLEFKVLHRGIEANSEKI